MADFYTQINDLTGAMPKVQGGAWGRKAFVDLEDGTRLEARGADHDAALMGLLAEAQKHFPTDHVNLPDLSGKRRGKSEVEAAKEVPVKVRPSLLSNGHQEGAHEGVTVPGCPDCQPVAGRGNGEAPRGKGTGRPRACDVSCVFAHKDDCVCQCEGANHATGWLIFEQEITQDAVFAVIAGWDGPNRVKGGRVCLCGCGETTKGGRFLQGHDRKAHAKMADVVEGSGFFKEEDEVGLVMTPLGRKIVKAKRA